MKSEAIALKLLQFLLLSGSLGWSVPAVAQEVVGLKFEVIPQFVDLAVHTSPERFLVSTSGGVIASDLLSVPGSTSQLELFSTLPIQVTQQLNQGSEIQQQLQQLIDRQTQLEQENSQLRDEIRQLKQQVNQLAPREGSTTATEEQIQQKVEQVVQQQEQKRPQVGVKPAGGGFFVSGENYEFRILGYVQGLMSVFDDDLNRDSNLDFSIRRARLNFITTLYKDFELFVEIDGAPSTTRSTDSDFGLTVAQLNWKVAGDAFQLRVGKQVTPFSTENFRSSRSIDTVERYMALNSLFLLPAVDSQFGVMLHGKVGQAKRLGYFAGVFNGNGSANANFRDNNDSKEFQAKLTYQPSQPLSLGLGFDYSFEEEQTLSLVDLGFNRYVSVPVNGRRVGVSSDLFWQQGPWSFRTEALAFRFNTADGSDVGLYGGFIQPAYFITGNDQRGVQALLRGEVSYLDANTDDDANTLWALTAGINWFINPNVRLQVNGTLHFLNGSSALQGFSDGRTIPQLLTELQFKF